MWPFRKKKVSKPAKIAKQMVVGVIIGGAIGSIVGKKLMEKHKVENDEDQADDESGFTTKDI